MTRFKLFCVPYAGGSAMVYSQWRKYMKDKIEIVPIELKGRGMRLNEAHYNLIEDAIEDVFRVIKENIEGCDYAIFGHSMGSLIAYEVYQRIIEEQIQMPKHMFFSGRQAPSIELKTQYYKLEEDKFLEVVKEYGGFTDDILKSVEIMRYFIPILRNDFKILEEYKYKEKVKISVGSSVFIGREDSVSIYEVLEWQNHIEGKCDIYMFNGGHFFIKNNLLEVTKRILNILKNKEVQYE
ncbi:thioesterase domain-containing protein [Paraclostridium ghonii]|uniref:Surfactin synthase thioesterase subunit n=1 Tax=Paraclostridium ghonii TaxID=29358 RepID=A0ABU0N025_9FIRM|nr:thioesterase domain-containing protein [Paeniclostridium ghonii]MDQ0556514.1 surfactin synthase thioesterase subunit [Paeniclostridium ghonii]